MANLSIPAIRERLFNTSKHEAATSRNSSNPFAQTSFKGNVLTADVFESYSVKADQPSFTGKLKASALVGSISDLGSRINKSIESIKNFGIRMKDSIVNGWNKLNNVEISFTPAKEKAVSMFNSVKETLGTSVTDLISSGVTSKSVAKMEDMTAARQLMTDSVAAWEAAMV